jgi:preprotein translocase subunit SecD
MQKGIVIALMAMLTGSLFVHPLCAQTDSNLTVDGVIYTNAVFGTVTPYAVTVKHSTGVASVPLERLPADLQQRFGYDPQKAQDYLRESTAQQAALLASDQQEAAARSGREHDAAVKADVAATEATDKAALVALTAEISGEVVVTTDGGMMLKTRNAISRTRYPDTTDSTADISGDRVTRTTTAETEYAFLVGYPGPLAPKTGLRCRAYPDGSKVIDGHTMPRWVYQSDGVALPYPSRDDR